MAIGDGSNDVNMIMQSDVGIGILGKEGSQAARAAEFSISKFKFLKPLLFVHGREAIRRNSLCINLTFYRNVVLIVTQYFFAFWSGYSGVLTVEPLHFMMFNITHAWAIFGINQIWDFEYLKDGPRSSKQLYFMRDPILYHKGQSGQYFTLSGYCKWFGYACV